MLRKNYKCELKRSCQLSFRISCVNGKIKHTHTHTHTHIYIYIYIYLPADNLSLQPHYCLTEREVETRMFTY